MFHACNQPEEHVQNRRGVANTQYSSLGRYSVNQDCGSAESKNTRVDKLLFQISEVGTTEVVQSFESSPVEMGPQQVS